MPMKLTILGSSSALPTSERYPSAHVLNVHERLYLIDCGEGTQMQLRKNKIRFATSLLLIKHGVEQDDGEKEREKKCDD